MWWLLGWCREHARPAHSAGSCGAARLMAPAPLAGSTAGWVGTTAGRSATPGDEDREDGAVTGVESRGSGRQAVTRRPPLVAPTATGRASATGPPSRRAARHPDAGGAEHRGPVGGRRDSDVQGRVEPVQQVQGPEPAARAALSGVLFGRRAQLHEPQLV